jgi:hypothetical protein
MHIIGTLTRTLIVAATYKNILPSSVTLRNYRFLEAHSARAHTRTQTHTHTNKQTKDDEPYPIEYKDFGERVCEDVISVVLYKDGNLWLVFVNEVLNLRLPYERETS